MYEATNPHRRWESEGRIHTPRTRLHTHTPRITPRFAFVDDDDVLSPDCVTRLLEESNINTLIEAVIFRMSVIFRDGFHILPPEDDVMFERERVGISFAIKRHLLKVAFGFSLHPRRILCC